MKEFTFPGSCHPLQLVSIERGAGQYITSEEFPSAARPASEGFGDKALPQTGFAPEGRLQKPKLCVPGGRGRVRGSEGCVFSFGHASDEPNRSTEQQGQSR